MFKRLLRAQAVILFICLLIATGCLSAGYLFAGTWLVLPVLVVLFIVWILVKNEPKFWSASGPLLAYLFLSVIGIEAGMPSLLAVVGCVAALVCWDLLLFGQSMDTRIRESSVSLEVIHRRSLGLAAFSGLALAVISLSINLQLPFIFILLLVLMAMGFFTSGVKLILNKKDES